MKTLQKLVLAASSAALLACGGGGSSTSTTVVPPTYPNTAKYLGTWNGPCDTSSDIRANGATGSNTVTSFALTTNTATTASGVTLTKVFGNTDTNCIGSQLGTLSRNITITVDGVAAGASGSDTIGVVIQNAANSGTSVTLSANGNSIVYANSTSLGGTFKDLAKFTATTVTLGDSSTAANANSYPTALGTTIYDVYTKQ